MTPPVYEAWADREGLSAGWSDLREGMQKYRIWRELVRRDVVGKTRGSRLGFTWIIIAQAAATAGIGLVYGRLFGLPIEEYIPYLAIGLIVWSLMITMISEASNCFASNRAYLLQSRIPLSLCCYRLVARNIALFFLKSIIIVAVLVIFQVEQSWYSLMAIPGLAVIAFAGFLTAITLGYVNAKYRDVGQFVTAATVFLFFMTPVIWKSNRLGSYAWVAEWNPLYHFLNLVRSPLLQQELSSHSFAMVGASLLILTLTSVSVYRIWGRRILYWL
ncbi:MAG: ABC transporter permease [Ahrensia sp.]|nr:ABC transporter permease [Ahrensia sp.]